MKVYISIIIFLATSLAVSAQTGNYFVSHYSPDEERFNIVCFDMVQDARGVFYFATQAGILQFDGRNWDIIPTVGTIYSVALSEEGEVYAAGSRGFGKIVRDERGLEMYSMIYEQADAEYIFQIHILMERVYFLSDQNLYEYDVSSNKVVTIAATPETGPFVSLAEVFNTIFVSTEENGIFKVENGKLTSTVFSLGDNSAILFSLPYGNHYLLGNTESQLFLCSPGFKLKEIILQDSAYLSTSVIVNASWVANELIAVGTLRGGIVFINPVTGSTEEIINYQTGLPDNEVFALITDRNYNVWAAHAYGFTRISPSLPFRSFLHYPGLQGNLLCATTFNDEIYVGTSVGLFALEKKEFYDEIRYYVEVPITTKINPSKTKTKSDPATTITQEEESKESQKGGFFRFLKRKRSTNKLAENKDEDASTIDDNEEVAVTPATRTTKREVRVKKILRSTYYAYRKIDGIDAKISQLLHWRGMLLASGLGGAFEVNKDRSIKIIDTPVRFLFASETRNKLIASTYDDRLQQYRYDENWYDDGVIENINEPVHHIFEEGSSAIWFCGFDKVFRQADSESDNSLQKLSFSNSNFDKTIGVYLNGEVIVASPAGFFFYDQKTHSLEKGDTVRIPIAYFANATNLWFRDKHNWYTAGSTGGHDNLQLLNLFSNLRFIDSDPRTGALWIITGTNELLQFNSSQIRKDEVIYPLMLKVIQHNDIVTARSYLKAVQDEGAFMVQVIKPDYIGNRFVEYRFLLEGLHKEWSDWSTQNNVIRFAYLPTGDYTLKVQARDIFGRISDMDPVILNIAPPYWKEPWFYGAEFSVFIFLVLLSFRLSYRFLIVSRLLSLLSIIMFIELIQTTVGETFSQSSPVIDFGIQVFVAMLILPVEGYLRRHFLLALAKRNEARMKQMIARKEKRVVYEPEDSDLVTSDNSEKK